MFSPQLLFPFSPELRFHFFKGVLGISEIFGKKSSLCMLTKFVYFYSAVCLHHQNVNQLLVTNQGEGSDKSWLYNRGSSLHANFVSSAVPARWIFALWIKVEIILWNSLTWILVTNSSLLFTFTQSLNPL